MWSERPCLTVGPFAFLAALLASCTPAAADRANSVISANSFTCTVAAVADGDTLRCRETDQGGRQIHVRLAGINARERNETCAPHHPCPDAPAWAATTALRGMVQDQVLTCEANGTTHGRIAAFCVRQGDGLDISCAMLATGTVLRWDRHWGGHRC